MTFPYASKERRPATVHPGTAIAVFAVGVVLVGMVITSTRPAHRAATLPAGTVLPAVLDHGLSTGTNRPGDAVWLQTTAPIRVGDDTVIPAGALVQGEIVYARTGALATGSPSLIVRFTELATATGQYRIESHLFRIHGMRDTVRHAGAIEVGAGPGAMLGGILGDLGGAAGAVGNDVPAGTDFLVAIDGGQLVVPAGTTLSVELASPLAVRYRAARSD